MFDAGALKLRYRCIADALRIFNSSLSKLGGYVDPGAVRRAYYAPVYMYNGSRRVIVDYILLARGTAYVNGSATEYLIGIEAYTGRYVKLSLDPWVLGITQSNYRNATYLLKRIEDFIGYNLSIYGDLRLIDKTESRYSVKYLYTVYLHGCKVVLPRWIEYYFLSFKIIIYANIKNAPWSGAGFESYVLAERDSVIGECGGPCGGFNASQYAIEILEANNVSSSSIRVVSVSYTPVFTLRYTVEQGPVYVYSRYYTVIVDVNGRDVTLSILYDCVEKNVISYRATW